MNYFNYKTNKTVTLGLLDKNNILGIKENILEKNDENLNILGKNCLFQANKNVVYTENIDKLLEILGLIKKELENIFKYESYHKFDIGYGFQLLERKKLSNGRLAKKALFNLIFKKYGKQFENFKNNIDILNEHFNSSEENKVKISNIVRLVRYIKNDLEKIGRFVDAYDYKGNNSQKKNSIENSRKIFKNESLFKILDFYSKRDISQREEFKIALNPAILNMHSEVNQESKKDELEELKKQLEKLEQQNGRDIKAKRNFEEDLEAYINHILYDNDFFKKSKNVKYRNKAKLIYEKYQNKDIVFEINEEIAGKNNFEIYQNFKHKIYNKENRYISYEDLVIDFLKKNEIKNDDENSEATINSKIQDLKSEFSIEDDDFDSIFSLIEKENFKGIENFSYIELKVILYNCIWQRAKIKENNKKEEEKISYESLSNYIKNLKLEINSRLTNTNCLYGVFIAPDGVKAKTAQKLGQKYGEYIQKVNFDKEVKEYTHFGILLRKGNQFFIKPFKKTEVLNQNQGFPKEQLDKILGKYRKDDGVYQGFVFHSLTIKALEKLIFIKEAFKGEVEIEKEIRDIYKKKLYKKHKYKSKQYADFLRKVLKTNRAKKLFPYLNLVKLDNANHGFDLDFFNFHKEFIKQAYIVEQHNFDFNEKDLVELDMVYRTFEHVKGVEPKLKRNDDFKLFVNGFFDKQDFDLIRMIPETKVFVRYQRNYDEPKKEKRGKKENIIPEERFYNTVIKGAFNFELKPLEADKNIAREKKKILKDILSKYENDDNFYITTIDIGENSLATLGVYDKNLKPQKLEYFSKDGEKITKEILDITNLKIKKGEIIEQDTDFSQKYKAYKYMFENIILWQIYLKEILEAIEEIEVIEQNYGEIKNRIGKAVNGSEIKNFVSKKKDDYDIKYIVGAFPELKEGLNNFLVNFIKKEYEGEKINFAEDKKVYHEIFQKLELQKVVDFKKAFGSNFVGVIKKIFRQYPGIIVFESLHTGDSYDGFNKIIKKKIKKVSSEKSHQFTSFGTYIGTKIVNLLFNKFTKDISENFNKIEQLVILDKNYENSVKLNSKEDKFINNGVLFFVHEKNTSKACPYCNERLTIENKEKGTLENIDDTKNLYGHGKGKEFEHSMCHINDVSDQNYENGKWTSGTLEGGKMCDFRIGNETYEKEFGFIHSGDELATYNIAKKAKEYLDFLKENN
ncbi:hypothetical protein HXK64_00205 [Candidatus Gracilibacteria bacterium]|nr:hypothetical protein [Candidatus Gracilibacteria bacterium]